MTADSWYDYAACQGSPLDWFVEVSGTRGEPEAEQAKAVCKWCPVRRPCLDYALDAGEKFGIWGGASTTQRQHLRRQRRQEAA
jgi:WhiB family redox-sensing transcriptional regulator